MPKANSMEGGFKPLLTPDQLKDVIERLTAPIPEPEPVRTHPLLLFSGGMDSTYMLWNALEKGPVHTLYAYGGQSIIKEHAEKKARKRIMDYMEKHRPFKILSDDEIKIRGVLKCPDGAWEQPYSWFMAALQHLHPSRMSEVQIGTILNDDGAPFCGRLQTAWDNLLHALYPQDATIPRLQFPLWNISKTQIFKALPPALRKLTWTCELPLWRGGHAVRCNLCKPCRAFKHVTALVTEGYMPPHMGTHLSNFMTWQKVAEAPEPPQLVECGVKEVKPT